MYVSRTSGNTVAYYNKQKTPWGSLHLGKVYLRELRWYSSTVNRVNVCSVVVGSEWKKKKNTDLPGGLPLMLFSLLALPSLPEMILIRAHLTWNANWPFSPPPPLGLSASSSLPLSLSLSPLAGKWCPSQPRWKGGLLSFSPCVWSSLLPTVIFVMDTRLFCSRLYYKSNSSLYPLLLLSLPSSYSHSAETIFNWPTMGKCLVLCTNIHTRLPNVHSSRSRLFSATARVLKTCNQDQQSQNTLLVDSTCASWFSLCPVNCLTLQMLPVAH